MGEMAINPKHNVHKKYREVIYVNPFLMTAPVPVIVENTFIGGVAVTLYTSQLLATKLAIDVSRITAFSVLGSDIKCKITGSYVIPPACFQNDQLLTYYHDFGNLITGLGNLSFSNCLNFKYFYSNSITSSGSRLFQLSPLKNIVLPNLISCVSPVFNDIIVKTSIYIPACTYIGSNPAVNELSFHKIKIATKLYLNPFLSTNNAGGEDANVVYARNNGAIIRYVTSFVSPNAVSDLSIETRYDTAIKLNCTTPSGSVNAIDYYEVYANNIHNCDCNLQSVFAKDLVANTLYKLSVYAVDIFKNKSIVSNSISVATTNTGVVSLFEKTAAAYPLSSGVELKNGYEGMLGSGVSFSTGKNGNCANFNGTGIITIDLSEIVTTKASVNFWIKLVNHTPSSIEKTGLISINPETNNSHYPFSDGNIYCGILTNSRKTIGIGIVSDRTQWHMVTVTADSVANVWKFYQNGTLITTSTVGTFSFLPNATIGKSIGEIYGNNSMDEFYIFKDVLNQTEITNLHNGGLGKFYPNF